MSYCKDFGKDKVIFVTEEDYKQPSTESLPPEDESPRGLILPNGDINWGCPCLGGTASGPCAFEFREAFSCFHNSTSDPKGGDCLEKFQSMSKCMASYPTLYPKDEGDDRDKWDQNRLDDELKALDDDEGSKGANNVEEVASPTTSVANNENKQQNSS
ncbi:Mitochondrial intermembrane space import and assembly protein 40 [Halotydeus destructor]|nr:Mitochondrial intermembrane space import and assembly protein 40 [Halotydeus destructor]